MYTFHYTVSLRSRLRRSKSYTRAVYATSVVALPPGRRGGGGHDTATVRDATLYQLTALLPHVTKSSILYVRIWSVSFW